MTSIMGNPTQRGEHIKDVIDFLAGLEDGALPAVSFVKPDAFVVGVRRPRSSICSRRCWTT